MRNVEILRSLVLVLMLTVLAVPAVSQDSSTADEATDTADVYETKHNHVLAFPKYVWNVLIYPIKQFTLWVDHNAVHERVVDLFTNEAETFGLFPYGTLGGETGTGGGFNLFHNDLFGRGKEFSARLITNRSNRTWGALYNDPGIGGGPWYWNASIEALDTSHQNATINGSGINGKGEPFVDGSLFAYDQRDIGLNLGFHSNYAETEGYEPDALMELRLSHGFRRYDAIDSESTKTVSTEVGRSIDTLPGVNEGINLFSVGTRLAFDNRDFKPPTQSISHPLNYHLPGRVLLFTSDYYYSFRDLAFPEHGGLFQLEADYIVGSKDVRYFHYAAEVQHFFTLFYNNRILGLRARLEKAHALGDGGIIPYSDWATLGGKHRLRGYRRGFFRDEGSVLLSVEYRYPIWDTWNAFLFWDEGQVFKAYKDLNVGEFKYSFGAGISLRTESSFLLSLHIAHSKEEKVLVASSLEKEF